MTRNPLTRRTLLAAACVAGLCAPGSSALAQAYPAKPIRLVIPSSPGGGTDAIGRVLAWHRRGGRHGR